MVMTAGAAKDEGAPAAHGMPLKTELRRAQRRRKIMAWGLVAPALLFIIATFLVPIGTMLSRSVENFEVVTYLPRTASAIKAWDGQRLPGEVVYAALAEDLKRGYVARTAARVGKRLNYEIVGFRSLIIKSARKISKVQSGPYKAALIEFDERWGEKNYWVTIKRNARSYTDFYYLSALDLERNADGAIVSAPENRSIYFVISVRTLWISVLITLICLAISYPMAYVFATLPPATSNLLLILVLLPFWTSALVRTAAWITLLQREGLVNDLLILIGIIDEPVRLIFNRFGVVIAMTYVMLPFTIFPLYSVMKGIDPQYWRAAISLGAKPMQAFWRVYLPLTKPGISAGGLLVFIQTIGFFTTPALIGGRKDQMLSYFIALNTNEILNWGLAAALATLLLVVVLALYFVYNRFVGIEQIH